MKIEKMESSAVLTGIRLSSSISLSRHSSPFLSPAFPLKPSLSLKVFPFPSLFPSSSLINSSRFSFPFYSSKSSFLSLLRMFSKLLLLSGLLLLFPIPTTGSSFIFLLNKIICFRFLIFLLFSTLFDCNDVKMMQ